MTNQASVESVEFSETTSTHDQVHRPVIAPDSPLLRDVSVSIEARLGEAVISVAELLALRTGALLPLDTPLGGQIDLYLNRALVARGEIVAVGDQFGVRISEILEQQ